MNATKEREKKQIKWLFDKKADKLYRYDNIVYQDGEFTKGADITEVRESLKEIVESTK